MNVPEFDQLPVHEGIGLRHAWSVFGPHDELGTLNFLTPDRVRAASALVRTGETVNLTLPLTAFDPPFYSREPLRHSVYRLDRNYWDDKLDNLALQGSSHWDGLRHMQAREFGWYGGLRDESEVRAGGGPLGIERWAQRGIIGRGVLLDVAAELAAEDAAYDPFVSRSVDASVLDAALRRQRVELAGGDILCLRFGWLARYRALDPAGRAAAAASHDYAGLAADEAMARWLWDHRVAAIACDNAAVEVSPGNREVGSLHRRLLPMLGFALGELFDFDALAQACRGDQRWEFLFVSVPLHLVGGVGSPANAVAVR